MTTSLTGRFFFPITSSAPNTFICLSGTNLTCLSNRPLSMPRRNDACFTDIPAGNQKINR